MSMQDGNHYLVTLNRDNQPSADNTPSVLIFLYCLPCQSHLVCTPGGCLLLSDVNLYKPLEVEGG